MKKGLSGSWVESLAQELFTDSSPAHREGCSGSSLEASSGRPTANSMSDTFYKYLILKIKYSNLMHPTTSSMKQATFPIV